MTKNLSRAQALFERARQVMPWGVSSNFRYLGEDTTPVIVRGKGSHIWDADGREYIDYRLGFGPVILGHGDPRVVKRVSEAVADGTLYAHTHPLEISVAERIVRMCPGVDMVRFANSGAEATMHSLRVARAYTGREKILKFEGQYHGSYDYVLFSTASSPAGALGSRRSPIAAAASSGIPRALHDLIVLLPYNDFEALERRVKAEWGHIAAILVEPVAGNFASVMPEPGWLEHIRKLCDDHGIVMIMDEVKTGFRIARGGATEYFGVKGDLMTYAKSIANGFPTAVFGGKREVMMTIEPGDTAHAGTYCGNVAGTAAADATLEILETTDALETIATRGRRLHEGIGEILTEAGIEHSLQGPPQMPGFVLGTSRPPRDYREVLETDLSLYEKLGEAMRAVGVEYEADCREPLFLCEAHTEADVDETLNKFNDAVKQFQKKHLE